MSTLRTQKVTPLDGETNLILGDSGDTVTIPSGVTLAGSGANLTNLPAHTGNVAFPATQVPDADANTLDDYEEGTWTPVLKYGGGNTGMSNTSGFGRYTKIGDLVTFEWTFGVGSSAGSSTGTARIAGLPFTSSSAPNVQLTVGTFSMANGDSVSGGLLTQILVSSSELQLWQTVTGDNSTLNHTMADADATLYGIGQFWVNNI
jgi:hypothetical protein